MSESLVACPGFHTGHSARRSQDGQTCDRCGGAMPPVPTLRCTCEPHVWDDGSVTHEDDCDIYPWCPHEMGAYVCDQPCGCRCNGCTALSLGYAAYQQAHSKRSPMPDDACRKRTSQPEGGA